AKTKMTCPTEVVRNLPDVTVAERPQESGG
ncbi:hypothetical protein LCGC14_2940880, partial [marine sediment metagenome]